MQCSELPTMSAPTSATDHTLVGSEVGGWGKPRSVGRPTKSTPTCNSEHCIHGGRLHRNLTLPLLGLFATWTEMMSLQSDVRPLLPSAALSFPRHRCSP